MHVRCGRSVKSGTLYRGTHVVIWHFLGVSGLPLMPEKLFYMSNDCQGSKRANSYRIQYSKGRPCTSYQVHCLSVTSSSCSLVSDFFPTYISDEENLPTIKQRRRRERRQVNENFQPPTDKANTSLSFFLSWPTLRTDTCLVCIRNLPYKIQKCLHP